MARPPRVTGKGYKVSSHPLYQAWKSMHRRCDTPYVNDYEHYGGRGIKVCDEWKDSLTFLNWAENNGWIPNKGLTLDRINANKDYEPSNCRWVTQKQQARNRRNNRLVTIDGVTKCVQEWAEEYSINKVTFLNRVDRGWEGKRLLKQTKRGKQNETS